MKFRRDITKRY